MINTEPTKLQKLETKIDKLESEWEETILQINILSSEYDANDKNMLQNENDMNYFELNAEEHWTEYKDTIKIKWKRIHLREFEQNCQRILNLMNDQSRLLKTQDFIQEQLNDLENKQNRLDARIDVLTNQLVEMNGKNHHNANDETLPPR
ncbi:hypothetical protein RF11_08591 [Thelohanellus kitauei]|uniref:Uncharacterized protein n=1 Tax=Thelohanellus kitauei TaxID=669202 RepID=A0A0C2IRI7_THEKT|nr:hypothetical protein RF11_08591 [Thelohanellus kitauei]